MGAAVRFHARAQRLRFLARLVVTERGHIRRRRRRRRAEHVLEDPLAAQHGRRAIRIRRDRQDAALAEQAATRFLRDVHATEVTAVFGIP